MILINSADYVNSEFRNELGAIPPIFLPIGNKKLLTYQVTLLREHFSEKEPIVVSLPQKYNLSIDEQKLIQHLNIKTVFVPEGISLGMAILYVLNTIEVNANNIRLLHGDTLLDNFPSDDDCIALAKTQDEYNWEFKNDKEKDLIWCGYFSFSSTKKFIRELAITYGDFAKSVYNYANNESNLAYPEIKGWYDLGHINTYFSSRSKITTQRAFNLLRIENGVVWKSGSPAIKIKAEANWFNNLPVQLKRFTPQLIQLGCIDNDVFYETEYLSILPLNEIFVHGKKGAGYWGGIVGLVANFLQEARVCFPSRDDSELQKVIADSNALYAKKTNERLKAYAEQANIDLSKPTKYAGIDLPSLQQITQECIDKALRLPVIPAVLHGDLCFSNIMYNSRSHHIKVIDPRGLNVEQELTIYGNQSYDLAKLCHSIVGLYDFIIADSFEIKKSNELGVELIFNIDDRLKEIQENFISGSIIPEINNRDIIAPTILLFLSMLPLHSDKPRRQEAMLANVLRLYTKYCV